MSWIKKTDWLSVRNVTHTIRHIRHKLHLSFSKLPFKNRKYCLSNKSDGLAVGKILSSFWWNNYEKAVLRYSLTIRQYFCGEDSLIMKEDWFKAQQLTTVSAILKTTTTIFGKRTRKYGLRLPWGFSLESSSLRPDKHTKFFDMRVLVYNSKSKEAYHSNL